MAKKQKFSATYDAPVTLTFVLATSVILLLDIFVLKGSLTAKALSCPSAARFNFSNPLDYLKILGGVLGIKSFAVFFVNTAFLLLLGPQAEERFGSIFTGIMLFISTLVWGVLNVCFSKTATCGSYPLVLTLVFLNLQENITKKKLPVSWMLIFIMASGFMIQQNLEEAGKKLTLMEGLMANMPYYTALVAGLLGSLSGFFAKPKKINRKNQDDTITYEEARRQKSKSVKISAREKKADPTVADSNSDTTVVGTIEL